MRLYTKTHTLYTIFLHTFFYLKTPGILHRVPGVLRMYLKLLSLTVLVYRSIIVLKNN